MKTPSGLAILVLGAAAATSLHGRADAFDPMTPGQILANAETGMGYSYWWGGGRWDPAGHACPGKCTPTKKGSGCPHCSHSATKGCPEYGADCSGFTAKVWQVPNATPMTTQGHPYVAADFTKNTQYWKRVARKDWAPGDALASAKHVMIFEGWTGGGKALVYECAGCLTGCVHRVRSIGSGYVGARRVGTTSSPKEPTGKLESAQCGAVKGWAYDPAASSANVEVSVYFGGPIGDAKATLVKTVAKLERPDLCSKLGSCNHGFEVQAPAEYQDGKPHPVYAYAADAAGFVKKTALPGSPQSAVCAASCAELAKARNWYGWACEKSGNGACGGVGDKTPDCDRCCGSSCVFDEDCSGGLVCAWNGHVYCCRTGGATGPTCASKNDCTDDTVCAWNGKSFMCVAPSCSDM